MRSKICFLHCTFHPQLGQENWGIDSPTHCLKQESNWLPYVRIRAELDAAQEKMWTQLRQTSNTDEILRMQSHFIHVTDSEVQGSFKKKLLVSINKIVQQGIYNFVSAIVIGCFV